MLLYNIFPNGKRRIVTFSYDDGQINDERLVKLFNKYSVKGTFHLNECRDSFKNRISTLTDMYKGHEISCHSTHHGYLEHMPCESLISEIMNNRKALEGIAGYPVVGMSYPYGTYSEEVINALRACGIVYSRTTKATNNFDFPADFIEWHPSCHHRDALKLCERFLAEMDNIHARPLFYIWGHSFELRNEEDWDYMEKVVSSLSGNDKIWYATNIEIYNYRKAQKSLVVSADEKIIYNPSATDVWVEKDRKDVIHIPAGETVYL